MKKVEIQIIWGTALCLLPNLQGSVKDKETIVMERYLWCGFQEEKRKAKGCVRALKYLVEE